jgi:membrane associated rhomboid family serine protease
MTDFPTPTPAAAAENRCYRHPDRESFIRCQRCGRPICPQCQTQAPVGVHCPECVKQARAAHPRSARVTTRATRVLGTASGRPIVTYAIIALCLVIYGIQFLTGSALTQAGWYAGVYTASEPWRMITSIFLHQSILHVGLNMYSLWIVGPALEIALGRVRYLALFFIAGFGGSVGVLLLASPLEPVIGASGAVFGLFGAYFIVQRRLGGNATQMLVLIVINLVVGFIPSLGIAWQAHVGGLVAGAAVAFVYLETRRINQRALQIVLTAAVAVVLIVITALKVALF